MCAVLSSTLSFGRGCVVTQFKKRRGREGARRGGQEKRRRREARRVLSIPPPPAPFFFLSLSPSLDLPVQRVALEMLVVLHQLEALRRVLAVLRSENGGRGWVRWRKMGEVERGRGRVVREVGGVWREAAAPLLACARDTPISARPPQGAPPQVPGCLLLGGLALRLAQAPRAWAEKERRNGIRTSLFFLFSFLFYLLRRVPGRRQPLRPGLRALDGDDAADTWEKKENG